MHRSYKIIFVVKTDTNGSVDDALPTRQYIIIQPATYTCGDITYCQYGIPIYIATEILPVTIIFLVILLFNISLTSGALYSFVFYAQILLRLIVSAFNIINISHHSTKIIFDFLHFVLGVFVFDIQGDRLGFLHYPN